MVAYISLLLGGLGVLLVAIACCRPPEFEVRRSALIGAPAGIVFGYIDDLRRWQQWSPFAQGPDLSIQYSGPSNGVGASSSWNSRRMGAGQATIVESIPGRLVEVRLDMKAPLRATNRVRFMLSDEAAAIRVTWTMDGRNGFVAKLAGMFVDTDRIIGDMFEQGLARLKALSEAGAPEELRDHESFSAI